MTTGLGTSKTHSSQKQFALITFSFIGSRCDNRPDVLLTAIFNRPLAVIHSDIHANGTLTGFLEGLHFVPIEPGIALNALSRAFDARITD
jgi:hypothetical protein